MGDHLLHTLWLSEWCSYYVLLNYAGPLCVCVQVLESSVSSCIYGINTSNREIRVRHINHKIHFVFGDTLGCLEHMPWASLKLAPNKEMRWHSEKNVARTMRKKYNTDASFLFPTACNTSNSNKRRKLESSRFGLNAPKPPARKRKKKLHYIFYIYYTQNLPSPLVAL